MKLKILFLFLFSIFIPELHAGAYVLPVSYVGTRVIQKVVAWDEQDNIQNPCYGWSACYLGPDVQYPKSGPGLYGSCIDGNNCIRIERYQTTKQVADAWKKAKGVPWTSNEYNVMNSQGTCVGMFYIEKPVMGYSNESALFPDSVCGKLPPVNISCSITMPSTINFGTISNEKNQKFTKSISGSLSCTGGSTYLKVYTQSTTGEKNLYLNRDKTLVTTMLLNNSDAFSGINMKGSTSATPLTLQTTLSVSGRVEAGDYSGNILVYLAYV
ncbi:MrpH family fimbial adhesin [Klebsiella aerogenes]|uniref:MrpH family fimbial adhesin n=1 Tax=Klebsiella aerogenes TaxID=548 RepID=UPI001BCBBD36|nr:hypothetical protein [Klebsiella aerogenes]